MTRHGKEVKPPLAGCPVQPVCSDCIYGDLRHIETALWKFITLVDLLASKLKVWAYPHYYPHQLYNLGHISEILVSQFLHPLNEATNSAHFIEMW